MAVLFANVQSSAVKLPQSLKTAPCLMEPLLLEMMQLATVREPKCAPFRPFQMAGPFSPSLGMPRVRVKPSRTTVASLPLATWKQRKLSLPSTTTT